MLSPASQAKKILELDFLCKADPYTSPSQDKVKLFIVLHAF
jgi:hypothetical protein